MADSFITGEITGLKEVLAKLHALPNKIRKKILRPALRKAARPIRKTARDLCPVNDGYLSLIGLAGVLKKSIGTTTKTTRKTGTVTVKIGPRRGFKKDAAGNLVATAFSKSVSVVSTHAEHEVNPTFIASLVEYGHGGPHPAPAHPFMRPAWDQNRSQAEATLVSELTAGIEREASTA